MARRRTIGKREILPDPKFGDLIIAKFINMIMISGKKAVAEKIVYGALDQVAKNDDEKPSLLSDVLEKIAPVVEVKSRRVGGATYQVPVEVKENRKMTLAMRWLIEAARKRNEKTMVNRLSGEIKDIQTDRGATIKRKEDTHKMAQANRAFSNFRW